MSPCSLYVRLLTNSPVVVILAVLLVTLAAILPCLFVGNAPDFTNPIKGFVPRYTLIHREYYAWRALVDSTSIDRNDSKSLFTYPYKINVVPSNRNSADNSTGAKDNERNKKREIFRRDLSHVEENGTFVDRNTFFCDSKPDGNLAKIVVELQPSSDDARLISYQTYAQLCNLQNVIEQLTEYKPTCPLECQCHSLSLANHVAFYYEKASCDLVTTEELQRYISQGTPCLRHTLCAGPDCNRTKLDCDETNISPLANYYVNSNALQDGFIHYSLIYLHMPIGSALRPLYNSILKHKRELSLPNVKIAGIDFGMKDTLFDEALFLDSAWIGLALCLVLFIMWVYTGSLFITFMVLLSMCFTIIISYFLYTFVFQLDYFPFMNLLSAVVVISIGADDLFIFQTTWTAIKNNRNSSVLLRIVHCSFRHSASAMFVTSASTATAFFASLYTDILTIRCFAIFSGLCVIVQYLMVVTWIPATFVILEKYRLLISFHLDGEGMLSKCLSKLQVSFSKLSIQSMRRLGLISSLWYIWLPTFTLMAVASGAVLFVWPKFSLPAEDMFQMFSSDNLMEAYDLRLRSQFRLSEKHNSLPLSFVWGLDASTSFSYYDLESSIKLKSRPLPNLSNPDVQQWFLKFCLNLRQQAFIDNEKLQTSGCFSEQFHDWINQTCSKANDPCCKVKKTPDIDATACLADWSINNHHSLYSSSPGLRYYKGDSHPSFIIIRFWSNQYVTTNFTVMRDMYRSVQSFVRDQVLACPDDQKKCLPSIISGGLLFYDVQDVILRSLPWSLVVVLAACTVVFFLTTLNFLLTVCSIISIACSILTLLATLVLLGWQLHILESVVLLLSVGLSMDFTLHLAIAYQASHNTLDRKTRVQTCLHHIGGGITTAMVTTLVAGLAVLPAQIVTYQKLGVFLILVSLTSWVHAILFLPSILILIGPIGNFMQINLDCFNRKEKPYWQSKKNRHSDEMSSGVVTNTAPTVSSHIMLETMGSSDGKPEYYNESDSTSQLLETRVKLSAIDELSDSEISPLNHLHDL